MPRYQAELSDGRTVIIESDQPPTEDDFRKAMEEGKAQFAAPPAPKEQPKPSGSAIPAFVSSALKSVFPTAAGYEGAMAGVGLGGMAGIESGPGAIITGAAGALIGGTLAEMGQRKLMQVAVPDFLKQTEEEESQHPVASFAGGIAGALPTFRLSPGTVVKGLRALPAYKTGTEAERKLVTTAGAQLGLGAGIGVVSPLLHGQLPTVAGVGQQMAAMALLGHPRGYVEGLSPSTRIVRNQEAARLAEAIGKANATKEGVGKEGSQPKYPRAEAQRLSPETGRSDSPAPAKGLEKEAQVPLKESAAVSPEQQAAHEEALPRIAQTPEGFTLTVDGKTETFATREEAVQAGNEIMGGKREIKPDSQPLSREELQRRSEETKKREEQKKAEPETKPLTEDERAEAESIIQQMKDEAAGSADESGAPVYQEPTDENVPFSAPRRRKQLGIDWGEGEFFKATGKGIAVRWDKFEEWVRRELINEGLSIGEMKEAVRRRVFEEWIHNIVIQMEQKGALNPRDIVDFWRSLSWFEKGVTNLKYQGKWWNARKLTDYQLGHEAIRQRIQEAHEMGESEIGQTIALEKWSLQGLTQLQKIFKATRHGMGGLAPKDAQATFDKVLRAVEKAHADIDAKYTGPRAWETPPIGSAKNGFPSAMTRLPAARARAVEARRDLLVKYIDRANKQIDAADLKSQHDVRHAWTVHRDNAQRLLDQLESQIAREASEGEFPAAAKRKPEEERIQYMDDLVKRLGVRVQESTGEDRARAERMLSDATAERDRLKSQLPPQLIQGEEVTQAAYRTPEGTVEYGPHHPGILERLGKEPGTPESRNTPDFGFQTNKRPFVERELAAEIAKRSGQDLKKFEPGEPAHSDEIAQPGTDTPISEGPAAAGRQDPRTFPRDKKEQLLKLFNYAANEVAARTTYGYHDEVAKKRGYQMAWSNAGNRWYAYGQPTEKGENLHMDTNVIFVPGVTKASADLIAEHLPPLGLAAGSFEQGGQLRRMAADLDPNSAEYQEMARLFGEENIKMPTTQTMPYVERFMDVVDYKSQGGPAAGPRRRKPDIRQEPMLFGGLTEKGEQAPVGGPVLHTPPEERTVEINPPTEEEMAAARLPPPQGHEIYAVAQPFLTAEEPKYSDFKKAMFEKFGPVYGKKYAPSGWEDAWWKELRAAPAERLAQLIRNLKLEGALGIKKSTPRYSREELKALSDDIRYATNAAEHKAAIEALAEAKEQMRTGRQQKLSEERTAQLRDSISMGKRYRARVQSTIARKLFEDLIAEEEPEYLKPDVTVSDLDFDNQKTEFGAYYEFTENEAKSPKLIKMVLQDRARGPSTAPVSVSHRLLALRNRLNGKVELVSTYEDGRRGQVVWRPALRTYVPLEDVPQNMRALASLLVTEPVHKFEKFFKNTGDFNKFYERDNSLARSQPQVLEGPQRVARARLAGEEEGHKEYLEKRAAGRGMEAGMYQGPHAEDVRLQLGIGAGSLEQAVRGTRKLEGSEVRALHSVLREMNVTEPHDVGPFLDLLNATAERGEFEGRHYQALSALYKIASRVQRDWAQQNVNISGSELADETLKAVYLGFAHPDYGAPTPENFINSILTKYSWEPTRLGEKVEPGLQALPGERKPSPTEKELTMPWALRRALPDDPTYIGPHNPAEMTVANPGTIPGPETLAPEVQQYLSQVISEMTIPGSKQEGGPLGPYTPTKALPGVPLGPGEYGGQKFKGAVVKGEPKEMPHEAAVTRATARRLQHTYGPPEFVIKRKTIRPGELIEREYDIYGPQRPGNLPAAAGRIAQEYTDTMDRFKGIVLTSKVRSVTKNDIKGVADGVDRSGEHYVISNSDMVRWASIGEGEVKATRMERFGFKNYFNRPEAVKIREGVVPWNAALQVAETEEWARLKNEAWPEYRARKRAASDAGRAFNEPEPTFTQPTIPSPRHFDKLIRLAEAGIARAKSQSTNPDVWVRRRAKPYQAAAERLRELAQWAQSNLENERFRNTAQVYSTVMRDHLNVLLANGADVAARDYYVPGRYEGSLWDDYMLTFGDERILGTQYRMPKVYNNYYEAIAGGGSRKDAYYPVNLDVADLAQHSMLAGVRQFNRLVFGDWLKTLTDPKTGNKVALAPEMRPVNVRKPDPITGEMVLTQELTPQIPSEAGPDYELVWVAGEKQQPIAVRRDYASLVKSMFAQSAIPDLPIGKFALKGSAILKHGLILIVNTFHPGRLAQYATALGGGNWLDVKSGPKWKRGWSAITWNPEGMAMAVKAGMIPKESMDWAMQPIKVYDRDHIRTMTRRELALEFLANGLNATQVSDTLYRNAIQGLGRVGDWYYKHAVAPLTKFTFDKFTPGLIVESAIRNFERINATTRTPLSRQIRDIARDTNAFYGNMGRQGFFTNPTYRDIANIIMLAPMWQEGILRKEFTAASRVSGVSKLLGREAPYGSAAYFGPIVHGMFRGLLGYFIGSQLVNLATRGQFTWNNKEEGHSMDAWIPVGDGKTGLWLSPLSVFGEVTHDFLRYYQTKGTAWAAITRVGENKLGPWGRFATVLHDMKTPTGEQITSTGGVLAQAGKELAPLPIALGSAMKYAAYKSGGDVVLPGTVTPPAPGQMLQQGLSMTGVKTQIAGRPEQDVSRLADKFVKENNLKFSPYELVPTDEASYTKLRGAIRNQDYHGAAKILAGLRQVRTDKEILHGMKEASTRPFTGAAKSEKLFLYSLNNDQLDLYYKANLNRAQIYQDFINWYVTQP